MLVLDFGFVANKESGKCVAINVGLKYYLIWLDEWQNQGGE
jgi:hypothetical protein